MIESVTQYTQILVGLGSMFPKANLLPGLVELATDDNVTVRAAAVQAAVSMLAFLTTGTAYNYASLSD